MDGVKGPSSPIRGISIAKLRGRGNLQSVTGKASAAAAAVTRDYKYPGYNADESVYTAGQARPHAVTWVVSTSGTTDSYGYDGAGRMNARTVAGVASSVAWDPQGRVASVTQKKGTGDGTSTYVYDGGGNLLMRRTKSENVLYLEGHEPHRATGGTTLATRYYTAKGTSLAMRTARSTGGNGLLTWLLSDGQSSTQLSVGAADGVVVRRRTTPFGAARSTADALAASSDRGFLGKAEDDATGLDFLGVRVYDPSLGRFLTSDPLNTPYVPQTVNAYSYSGNNPVAFSDPTGYESCYPHYCSGSNGTYGDYKEENDPASPKCDGSSHDGTGSGHSGTGTGSGGSTPAPHLCDGCTTLPCLPDGIYVPGGGNDVAWSTTSILGEDDWTDYSTSAFHNPSGEEKTASITATFQQITQVTHQSTKRAGASITYEAGGKAGIPFVAEGETKIAVQANGDLTWSDSKSKSNSSQYEVQETIKIKKGERYGLSPTGKLGSYKTTYHHWDGSTSTKTWGYFQISTWSVVKYSETPRTLVPLSSGPAG
ncbi:RHS repeat-associated core domain-containing protein [Streptomyces sp. NPDC002308]